MADVYLSRNTLIEHVLETLKVIAFGQPPSASEFEAVDSHLDPILGELQARNIAPVINLDQVPLEQIEALAGCVARLVADKFSIQEPELSQLLGREEEPFSAENRLRAIVRSRPHRSPATPDYF